MELSKWEIFGLGFLLGTLVLPIAMGLIWDIRNLLRARGRKRDLRRAGESHKEDSRRA